MRKGYIRKNFGEIFYDKTSRLNVNIIAPNCYKKELNELFNALFYEISKVFHITEPVSRTGSSKGISSVARDIEVEQLFDKLKIEFPELDDKISENKKYHKQQTKIWKQTHKKNCIDCKAEIGYASKRCKSCGVKYRYYLNKMKKISYDTEENKDEQTQ